MKYSKEIRSARARARAEVTNVVYPRCLMTKARDAWARQASHRLGVELARGAVARARRARRPTRDGTPVGRRAFLDGRLPAGS